MTEKLPPVLLEQVYDKHFLARVNKAILGMFKKHIRDNYYVSGFTQFPDGKWIVRLERTLDSYSKEE